jgi:hypothetical protein
MRRQCSEFLRDQPRTVVEAVECDDDPTNGDSTIDREAVENAHDRLLLARRLGLAEPFRDDPFQGDSELRRTYAQALQQFRAGTEFVKPEASTAISQEPKPKPTREQYRERLQNW